MKKTVAGCVQATPQSNAGAQLTFQAIITYLFSAILILLMYSVGVGQDYKSLPIPKNVDLGSLDVYDDSDPEDRKEKSNRAREIKKLRSDLAKNALDVLLGKKKYEGQVKSKFDNWYSKVIFAEMTHSDEASLKVLSKNRTDFLNNLRRVRSDEAMLSLAKLTYEEMRKIVTDSSSPSYAPAVKINALLLLGEMNAVAPIARQRPPTPYPDALPFMITVVSGSAPDHLKAAAMIGIERHGMINAQNKKSIKGKVELKTLLVSLLGDKPKDRSPDLHYWMQRKAARLLGAYGDPSDGVSAALAKKIAGNERIWLKLEAAKAYGNLKFSSAADARSEVATKEIGKLFTFALRDEVNFIRGERNYLEELKARYDKKNSTPAGGASAGDKYAGDDISSGGGGAGASAPGGAGGASAPGGFGSGSGSGYGAYGGSLDEESDDLPNYKITIARRRVKMVTKYLLDAFAKESVDTGLYRFCTDDKVKGMADEIISELVAAQKATDIGLAEDEALDDVPSVEIEKALTKSADKLTKTLELFPPPPAKVDESKKAAPTKKGDAKSKDGKSPAKGS